jgi:hypothetical protein
MSEDSPMYTPGPDVNLSDILDMRMAADDLPIAVRVENIYVAPTETNAGWTKDGAIIVPKAVVRRIRAHIDATRRPLLRPKMPRDWTVVQAWNQSGDYDLSVGVTEWSPPFTTYREYAKYARMKLADVMDEYGLKRSELDDEIDLDIIEQMVRPEDGPGTAGTEVFENLPECMLETVGGLEETDLWAVMEGGGPGNSYTSLWSPSAFELSILQYVFDALDSRTVIVLGR